MCQGQLESSRVQQRCAFSFFGTGTTFFFFFFLHFQKMEIPGLGIDSWAEAFCDLCSDINISSALLLCNHVQAWVFQGLGCSEMLGCRGGCADLSVFIQVEQNMAKQGISWAQIVWCNVTSMVSPQLNLLSSSIFSPLTKTFLGSESVD